MTLSQLLSWCRTEYPEISDTDVQVLLRHVLVFSSAELISQGDKMLNKGQIENCRKLIKQRQQGYPVAYLTGSREFWSLPLVVNNQVLIPRHESELVVERVLALLQNNLKPRILELGTGSGAIALALASELPQSHIIATDRYSGALNIARTNQHRLEISNVEFMQSNWYKNIKDNKFDLICSNPPYVCTDDKHLREGDVRFEPKSALVATDNGLSNISHIINHGSKYLLDEGMIVLEHGYQQGESVRELLCQAHFTNVVTHQDLSGNDRVTEAQKR